MIEHVQYLEIWEEEDGCINNRPSARLEGLLERQQRQRSRASHQKKKKEKKKRKKGGSQGQVNIYGKEMKVARDMHCTETDTESEQGGWVSCGLGIARCRERDRV